VHTQTGLPDWPLKAKFQKSGFFKIWLAFENSFAFSALSWLFYIQKLSARKLYIIIFLNHFPFREMFFWSVTFGSISGISAAKSLGKQVSTVNR